MTDDASPLNTHQGKVIAVRGNVVDVRFPLPLPGRNHQLRTGANRNIILEVQTFVDVNTVRCIALNATRRLSRGMVAENRGACSKCRSANDYRNACSMCLVMRLMAEED